MSKTSKPNNVLNGKTSISPSQQTVDMMNRILTTKQLEDPTVQKVMEVIASDSFQKTVGTTRSTDAKRILPTLCLTRGNRGGKHGF